MEANSFGGYLHAYRYRWVKKLVNYNRRERQTDRHTEIIGQFPKWIKGNAWGAAEIDARASFILYYS